MKILQKQTRDNGDPLFRFFAREGNVGRRLLVQVRKDLRDVIKVCEGILKQTNHLRNLMSHLTKGIRIYESLQHRTNLFKGTIPDHWRRYKVTRTTAVSEWIPNLGRRLAQLEQIAQRESLNDVEVWLGGLFYPEAYVTATRQAVAHRKKWSLETLDLRLDLEQIQDPEAFIVDGEILDSTTSFMTYVMSGLILEGAAYSSNRLSLNSGQSVRLGPSQLRWVQVEPSDNAQNTSVNLPVYLNTDRSDVLFTVNLPFEGVGSNLVAMRAVCLTAGG